MQHSLHQYLFVALIGFLLVGPFDSLNAQSTDPWQEMQRMMRELRTQMQQGMTQFDSTFAGGRMQMRVSPDSSFFFFHSDTTFSSDGAPRNRQFEPFEREFSMPDFGDLFEGLFDFGQTSPSRPRQRQQQAPADDGNRSEDDLLPEERLRKTEPAKPGQQKPASKEKYKTYRL